MKKLAVITFIAFAAAASAQVHVRPHVNSNGTLVEGHYRGSPNKTDLDNYSTRGNTNPYTGEEGTKRPSYEQPSYQTPSYPAPRSSTYGTDCGHTASGRYVCR
jgi:hypothetical protein